MVVEILHHLECIELCGIFTTSAGEFTGFLNHQQYHENNAVFEFFILS